MYKLIYVLVSLVVSSFVFAGFGDEEEANKIEFNGNFDLQSRYFIEDSLTEIKPNFDLKLSYKTESTELKGTISYSDKKVEINTLNFLISYDSMDLLIGKEKLVWGKGDKLHVIDNINGENLTDFILPDYLDRKIGEYMMKSNFYIGDAGNLEIVYTPTFTGNEISKSGKWVPAPIKELNNFASDVTAYLMVNGTPLSILAGLEDKLDMPKYNHFDDGQVGIRFTNSTNGYDYGFCFYEGKDRMPTFNKEALANIKTRIFLEQTDPSNPLLATLPTVLTSLDNVNLHYDRTSMFGAEFGTVVLSVNTRAEGAFYYSNDDKNGDNPNVRNSKIAYLVGADREIGLHNINLNIQLKGQYILQNDKIEDNLYLDGKTNIDIDYNADDKYYQNLLVTKISDNFMNEKFAIESTFVYSLEDESLFINNEISYKLKDDIKVSFKYDVFDGKYGTTFGEFKKNNFCELKAEYSF